MTRTGIARAILCLVIMVGGLLTMPSAALPDAVVQPAVRFEVQNINRSKAQDPGCMPDGGTYEVRGHLVVPTSVLEADSRALTIYLHSAGAAGDTLWRHSVVPNYDWATEMAMLGRASLVIDMLGWGLSDHPHGNAVCVAAEADILHQVITSLRWGDYAIEGGSPPRFTTISVATFSGAAIVSQIEAYSWDDVDGLIVMGYSDPPTGVAFANVLPRIVAICAQGGENVNDDGTGPSGYLYAWPSREAHARDMTHNMDPAVVESVKASIIRDPCGGIMTGGGGIFADFVNVPSIHVPVLLVYGENDAMSPDRGAIVQNLLYAGNPDVTTEVMPETGHMMMLERTAPTLRTLVDKWLDARAL